MTPTQEKLKEEIQEKQKINRLIHFRTKHVHAVQGKAATLLNVTQSGLSLMETGDRKISMRLLESLYTKYNMNADWFLTGRGPETTKEQKAKNTIDVIGELQAEVSMLNKKIKVLEVNQNRAYNLIDELQQRLERLEK